MTGELTGGRGMWLIQFKYYLFKFEMLPHFEQSFCHCRYCHIISLYNTPKKSLHHYITLILWLSLSRRQSYHFIAVTPSPPAPTSRHYLNDVTHRSLPFFHREIMFFSCIGLVHVCIKLFYMPLYFMLSVPNCSCGFVNVAINKYGKNNLHI